MAGGPLVGLSFEQPAETIQSIALGTLNILEACHMLDKQSKVYYAGSNECFGDTKALPVNEITTFHSQSPKSIRILVGR